MLLREQPICTDCKDRRAVNRRASKRRTRSAKKAQPTPTQADLEAYWATLQRDILRRATSNKEQAAPSPAARKASKRLEDFADELLLAARPNREQPVNEVETAATETLRALTQRGRRWRAINDLDIETIPETNEDFALDDHYCLADPGAWVVEQERAAENPADDGVTIFERVERCLMPRCIMCDTETVTVEAPGPQALRLAA